MVIFILGGMRFILGVVATLCHGACVRGCTSACVRVCVYRKSHLQIIPVIHVEYEFIYRLPCIVLLFIVCKTVEKWHKLTACCSKLTSLKSSRIDPEL